MGAVATELIDDNVSNPGCMHYQALEQTQGGAGTIVGRMMLIMQPWQRLRCFDFPWCS